MVGVSARPVARPFIGLLLAVLVSTLLSVSVAPPSTAAGAVSGWAPTERATTTRVPPARLAVGKPGGRTERIVRAGQRGELRLRGLVRGGGKPEQAVRRLAVVVDGVPKPQHGIAYAPSLCSTCAQQSARFDIRVSLPAGKHDVTVEVKNRSGEVLVDRGRTAVVAIPRMSVSRNELVPKVRGLSKTTIRAASGGVPAHGNVLVRKVGGRAVARFDLGRGTSWSRTWLRNDQRGGKAGPGRYAVVTTLRPSGATLGRAVTMTERVRVLKPRRAPAGEVVATPLGVLQPVKVKHKVNQLHLEVHQAKNQVLVVDRYNRVLRQVPIAGNPAIPKPAVSYIPYRTPMSLDYDLEWKLPWFVSMIAGRGVGTHGIPRNVDDGRPSMSIADLGKTPGAGAPVSHGCLRMHDRNARWIYQNVPNGTPVHWFDRR